MTEPDRPLSPHLQVYRWLPAMAPSILHRASGVFLSLASLLLVYWLVAVARGPEAYAAAGRVFGSLPVRLLLAGAIAAFWYHLIAGLRHLALDADLGFDKVTARRSSAAVVVLAGVATLATLALAWHQLVLS